MRRLLAFLLAGFVFQLMIFPADVLGSAAAYDLTGQRFGVLAYVFTVVLVSALAVASAVVFLRMRYTLINRGDLKSTIAVNLVFGLTFGYAAGFGYDAVFGLAGALAYGLLGGFQRAQYSPASPEEGLKSAIGTNITIALTIEITFGISVALAFGIEYVPVIELSYALSTGLAFSLAIQPQGWRYLALLVCTRRWTRQWLPWRLGRFLKWSYEVGLLRIAGFGYQFRHRELQDYLAARPNDARFRDRENPGHTAVNTPPARTMPGPCSAARIAIPRRDAASGEPPCSGQMPSRTAIACADAGCAARSSALASTSAPTEASPAPAVTPSPSVPPPLVAASQGACQVSSAALEPGNVRPGGQASALDSGNAPAACRSGAAPPGRDRPCAPRRAAVRRTPSSSAIRRPWSPSRTTASSTAFRAVAASAPAALAFPQGLSDLSRSSGEGIVAEAADNFGGRRISPKCGGSRASPRRRPGPGRRREPGGR